MRSYATTPPCAMLPDVGRDAAVPRQPHGAIVVNWAMPELNRLRMVVALAILA